jgi:pimeloyl-ACP methyl ester carboxylesterase
VVALDFPGHGADTGMMTDLHGDAAKVTETLNELGEPAVLVGHSYGGAVITEAGEHPAVEHLVFIAAMALDVGESCSPLGRASPKTQVSPTRADPTSGRDSSEAHMTPSRSTPRSQPSVCSTAVTTPQQRGHSNVWRHTRFGISSNRLGASPGGRSPRPMPHAKGSRDSSWSSADPGGAMHRFLELAHGSLSVLVTSEACRRTLESGDSSGLSPPIESSRCSREEVVCSVPPEVENGRPRWGLPFSFAGNTPDSHRGHRFLRSRCVLPLSWRMAT